MLRPTAVAGWMPIIVIALAGCSSGDPGPKQKPTGQSDSGDGPVGCAALPPSVEIGTGAMEFEPLAAGDPVVMVHGPQGGWHLLGSVRTHSMEEVVRIQFVVTVESTGAEVANNSLYVQTIPDPDDECAGYYPGMYAYLTVDEIADGERDTPPELLSYETLVFTAIVTDDASQEPDPARVVTDAITITATPDPADIEDTGGDSGMPG